MNRPVLSLTPHGLHVVPLELIDIEEQERKTSGLDPASLAELAASIQRDGLLQPPLLRWQGSRLVVVAGERRVRACRMAGLVSLHAIVGTANAKRARLLRLAENHQRENLSTAETAQAVKALADEGMTLQEIATAFAKSKAWASKHMGVSRDDFSQRARFMLENGLCEDLEKLHLLSQIELTTSIRPLALADVVRNLNETSRAELRLILKKAKAGGDEEAEDAADDAEDAPTLSGKPPSTKTANLQLDQHTATVLLSALITDQRTAPSVTKLDTLAFLTKFVESTWPDAVTTPAPTITVAGARGYAGESRLVKFRDAKTGSTWTGKGMKPRWLVEALKVKDAKLSDFAM